MKIPLILCVVCILLLAACGGGSTNDSPSVQEPNTVTADVVTSDNNPDALNVPDGFDYKMHRDITVRLQVLDHNQNPGRFIGVQIFEPSHAPNKNPRAKIPAVAKLPKLILRGQTNQTGYFEQQLRIPGHLEQLEVQVSQLGIINRAVLNVSSHDLFHEFR